jgi:toxin ParE2
MIVRFEPSAQQEVADAMMYHEHISPKLADQFLAEFNASIQRITVHPRAWPPLGNRLRRCLLTDFPYQLVYEIEGGDIRVYAFAHLKRRPNYWRKRVPPKARNPRKP